MSRDVLLFLECCHFLVREQDEESRPSYERPKSPAVEAELLEDYIKTTTMAKFYYRRVQSQGNLDGGKCR